MKRGKLKEDEVFFTGVSQHAARGASEIITILVVPSRRLRRSELRDRPHSPNGLHPLLSRTCLCPIRIWYRHPHEGEELSMISIP